jgi:NTE family protein
VPIHLAVAASCAVPGYFAPVQIGGRSYIDGGVHSPTNAAVLRGAGLDLVVVISPMSGPAGWLPDIHAAGRRHASRLLAREIKALEAEGVRAVVFAPGADEQEVMGNDMLSRNRLPQVIQQAFLAAGAHAAEPDVAELIRLAAGR